jgi:hypothetical protein
MDDKREPSSEAAERERVLGEHIRSVRLGHGANCSSVGSVVDTLFASAVVTGAIFAAVCAALAREKVTVVGQTPTPARPEESAARAPESDEDARPDD